MKRYVKSNKYTFQDILSDAISEVNALSYDKVMMKVTKSEFNHYKASWLAELNDATTEDDIAYNKEFYLSQIYKKKYSPLI